MRNLLWLVLTFNAALLLSQGGMGAIVNCAIFLGGALALLFGTLRLRGDSRDAPAPR